MMERYKYDIYIDERKIAGCDDEETAMKMADALRGATVRPGSIFMQSGELSVGPGALFLDGNDLDMMIKAELGLASVSRGSKEVVGYVRVIIQWDDEPDESEDH